MAPLVRDSVSNTVLKSELFRNSTRDFLIEASNIVCDQSKINVLSRYYQIKVNSLINNDHDDLVYILKIGDQNSRCIKCGSQKHFKLKHRRNANKADIRKYSRYLRGFIALGCANCKCSKRVKLRGKKFIVQQQKLPSTNIAPTKHNNSSLQTSISLTPSTLIKSVKPTNQKFKSPKPKSLPPKHIIQTTGPNFSSRLRAFSCLLEEK